MDLFMTSTETRYPAALIGALNRNMHVERHQGAVDVVTYFDPLQLQRALFPRTEDSEAEVRDSAAGGPEILAVHLHTHDLTQEKFLQVMNADGSVMFRSAREKAGYGLHEQSFLNIVDQGWPRLKLEPGQRLEQHCLMDTNHLDHTVRFGLDWGDEMCAPLLVIGRQKEKLSHSLISGDSSDMKHIGRMLLSFFRDVATDVGRLTFGA